MNSGIKLRTIEHITHRSMKNHHVPELGQILGLNQVQEGWPGRLPPTLLAREERRWAVITRGSKLRVEAD